jgi:hypothetical protein
VRVYVKVIGPQGPKQVHKTKAIKVSSSEVRFDQSHETFRVNNVLGDAQYQMRVIDHANFGSDGVFGETLFSVDHLVSVTLEEKTIKVGGGDVLIKSSFVPSESARDRPS